jgi:hypothetical protein
MTAANRTNQIFFLGQRSFRSRHTARQIAFRFGIAVAAFSFAGLSVAKWPATSTYLLGALWVAGTIALATGVGLLTAFVLARIDVLHISQRGVRYGDRFWGWASVRAFRARRSGPNDTMQFHLWEGEDKGPGRLLAIDEPITSASAEDLMGRVQNHCQANKWDVACETSG